MAILKDLLIKGSYYAEHGATDPDLWTEMMINDYGEELKPHLNDIMPFSFMMAYERAGKNVYLKRDLRRELKKLKKMNRTLGKQIGKIIYWSFL
jgi:hypothetical protein